MTLPTVNTNQNQTSDKQSTSQFADTNSLSPNSSPRGSPRPSPKPQQKREHSRSDSHLSVVYSTPNKNDGSNISETSSTSGKSSDQLDITRPSTDTIKEKKEGAKKEKKKSSWYNVLYPTYKSRSEDFKRIFKEVPDDERLIVDYSCALQKEILVHGRLYITQNYLCFYANIFRWETTVTLSWKDITAITKEKTALVIPNAILLCDRNDKYFFTSFSSRDKTYMMLFRVWQNALLDQPMTQQEMWQWVHQCYGEELGLTSDDEDYVAPGCVDEVKLLAPSVESVTEVRSSRPFFKSSIDKILMAALRNNAPLVNHELQDNGQQDLNSENLLSSSPTADNLSMAGDDKSYREAQLSRSISADQVPTDQSDNTDVSDIERNARTESGESIATSCSNPHEGRQVLCETFPMHVDQLFTLLFTNSKFFLDFHATRRTSDLTQSAWMHNSTTGQKTRVVTLTVAINQSIGPKSAQVTETQVMVPCSKPGHLYSIDVETVNAGIPYADSFYVVVHYCLEKITEMETQLIVYAQIKYKKNVWSFAKGIIEKNCWQGLEEFYSALSKALLIECEEQIHPVIKRKSRRRGRKTPLPCEPKEIYSSSINHARIRGSTHSSRAPHNECVTWLVFAVLIVLVMLNVALYYKLWTLEEGTMPNPSPYTLLDLNILKNPPSTHEEWLQLLQKQEKIHAVEMKKWQRILKSAVQLLRKTEESLNELQHSINPTNSKLVDDLKTHTDCQVGTDADCDEKDYKGGGKSDASHTSETNKCINCGVDL